VADDAYARRQKRKQREGQGCALLIIAAVGVAAVIGLLAGVDHLASLDTLVHIEDWIGG
jgi:hypothetical protein